MKKSPNSTNYYKQGIILDEINLATNELLEFLYSYLISIFYEDELEDENNKNYISPDGVKYERIGNIGVIATMNDANLSSSRFSFLFEFMSFI